MVSIEYTSLSRIDSFWQALDQVARERKYLLFTEGPPLEGTKEFINTIIENNWTQYFAVDNERVVGWCDILPHTREGINHVAQVGMGVIREYRGQGLGTRLLQTCIDDVFSKGITRIELEAFASNQSAIQLYKKIGFVQEGIKRKARFIDNTYDDLIIMSHLHPSIETE